MAKKLTHEEFVKKAKLIHGNKYEFLSEYNGSMFPITLRCKKCNKVFTMIANNFLSKGQGCKECYGGQPNEAYDVDTWIAMCKLKHNNYYQYNKEILNYENGKSKVKVICPKHGIFEVVARHHLCGHGCKECAKEKYCATHRKTHEQFLEDAKKVHGDKYLYLTDYVNAKTPLKILCKECGNIFHQTPHKHINAKHGCPNCNTSKLEEKIKTLLSSENVPFSQQHKFPWLGLQSLDFYLPNYSIAIECQGEQHFQSVEHFGGEKEFQATIERDTRKRKLCEENGVKLFYFAEKEYTNAPYKLFIDKSELLKEIRNYAESIRNTTTSPN